MKYGVHNSIASMLNFPILIVVLSRFWLWLIERTSLILGNVHQVFGKGTWCCQFTFIWEFLVQEIMHIFTETGEKWQVEQNVNNWWICVKDVGEIVTLLLQFEIKSSENLTKKSYPPTHQIHLFSMCNISEQTRWKCRSLCSNTNPRIGFRVIRRQKGPVPNNISIFQWHMVCKIQVSSSFGY